jgi:hypothetical protein
MVASELEKLDGASRVQEDRPLARAGSTSSETLPAGVGGREGSWTGQQLEQSHGTGLRIPVPVPTSASHLPCKHIPPILPASWGVCIGSPAVWCCPH